MSHPDYPGDMLRASALLVSLGSLALACGESVEPSIAYRYEVHGRASDVRITYLTEEAGTRRENGDTSVDQSGVPGRQGNLAR